MGQLAATGTDDNFMARFNDCAGFLTHEERDRIVLCVNACAGISDGDLGDYQDGSLKDWIAEADDALFRVGASLESVDYSGAYCDGVERLKAALAPFASPWLYVGLLDDNLDDDYVLIDTGHAKLTVRDFRRARCIGG